MPKDVQAFIRLAEHAGVDFALLKEVEKVNKGRIDLFLKKVRGALWVVNHKQVGVLGLAFKPNTDDIRFAPSLEVIRRLLAEGARVAACDPQAMEKTRAIFPQVRYSPDPYDVARDADALLILTEWEEFGRLEWRRIRRLMARPLVIDGRNLLDPAMMRQLGFEYYGFGRHVENPVPGLEPTDVRPTRGEEFDLGQAGSKCSSLVNRHSTFPAMEAPGAIS